MTEVYCNFTFNVQNYRNDSNRLIHGYFEIDLDIVWAIVEQDLPDLVPRLENILAQISAS